MEYALVNTNIKIDTLESMANLLVKTRTLHEALKCRDKETAEHSEGVANISFLLAQELQMDIVYRYWAYIAGILHDIGKIEMSDTILKSGKANLSEHEQNIIKNHPYHSYRTAHRLNFPKDICEALLYHHERFDGSGYPDGLTGNAIPILARIVAVGDAYHAIRSQRNYKQAFSIEDTITIMKNEIKKYDPIIFQKLIWLIEKKEIL